MTDAQEEALQVVNNYILEAHSSNDFNELVIDDGVKCHYNKGELEHVITKREFFIEPQDDDTILITVDEECDYGIRSTSPLYLIDPNGEIHDL